VFFISSYVHIYESAKMWSSIDAETPISIAQPFSGRTNGCGGRATLPDERIKLRLQTIYGGQPTSRTKTAVAITHTSSISCSSDASHRSAAEAARRRRRWHATMTTSTTDLINSDMKTRRLRRLLPRSSSDGWHSRRAGRLCVAPARGARCGKSHFLAYVRMIITDTQNSDAKKSHLIPTNMAVITPRWIRSPK